MKDMLDIVRKAMVIKKQIEGKKATKDYVIYFDAQLQILDHIINSEAEDVKEELKEMYNNSIKHHHMNNTEEGDKSLLVQVSGSADIIAWVLDIPKKINEFHKLEGQLGNYVIS